jgi:hypothetical protein
MSLPRRISRFETHLDPPTQIGFLGLIVVARPKRCPQWAKRLHIRLTGSRAVTNRHTSEAQSPAPGTSCFEIEWDILEGRERSWGLGFGSFFFLCWVVCFVFLLTHLFFGFITSCCTSLLYVIKIPNDFLSPIGRNDNTLRVLVSFPIFQIA